MNQLKVNFYLVIIAFSKHFLINDLGKKIKCINCNSFATPMITAKVCEIIFNKGIEDFEQLKLELSIYVKNIIRVQYVLITRHINVKKLSIYNIVKLGAK